MHLKQVLFGLFIVIVLWQSGWAQKNGSLMFNQGLAYYKQTQYSLAQRTFFQILKEYPNTSYLTATKLMLAKSYYKLEEYRSALIVSKNFIQVHPHSSYLDDIYFLMGKIYFRQQEYSDAVDKWLWVVNNEADSRLKKRAGNFIYHTLEQYLTHREIEALKRKHTDETFAGLVQIVQAQKRLNQGRREEGRKQLQKFIEKYPYHLYADIARRILEGKPTVSITGNTILVLKSGQEGVKPVSDAIALGIMYAAYELDARGEHQNWQIDTVNVGSDILSSLKKVLPLLEDRPPLAVIGPIDDDQNATFALLSRYQYFPFIAPTTTRTGLAALSPYTFQINPDAEIKGQFLGEYATRELGFKTFAILAPADSYGQTIASSFEKAVVNNGGELVEKQWYYEDTQDFSRQFKAIRKKGFYIAFRDSVLAAADTQVREPTDSLPGEEEIKQQFKQYMTQTLFSDRNKSEIDSTQTPSTGIDALFVAAYPDDIQYIAPQFAFYNIECNLLGNEGWNDPEQLQQQRVYIDGLVYVTAGYYDPASFEYKTFTNRFRRQMHTTPGMYHLLGYDVGKWLLSHIRDNMTPRELRDSLENGSDYHGILENIKFGRKPRVNSELNVIKFYMGQIMKVE